MRKKWTLAAAMVGACAALAVPAGIASAERGARKSDHQSAADEGYTVNIDRSGSAPMSECVVTNVRNPKTVQQWVPYIGPGRGGSAATAHWCWKLSASRSRSRWTATAADADSTTEEGPAGGGTGRAFFCARPTPAQGYAPAPVLRRAGRGRRRPWSARRTDRRRAARCRPCPCRRSWSTTRPAAWRRRCRRSS